MIKSGGSFFYKGKRCVIGAVISLKGLHYIVTASHIFHGKEYHVEVDGMEAAVKTVVKDFDLALIELPSDCIVEITNFGKAVVLDDALLANEMHVIACRVINAGSSLLYLSFFSDIPQPGDSGSPILQAGKVIGLISSMRLSTCMGTAISADVLINMIR